MNNGFVVNFENCLLILELDFEINGADNGIRTRDPQLGKLMLYQLSYVRPRWLIIIGDNRFCKAEEILPKRSTKAGVMTIMAGYYPVIFCRTF